MERAEEFGKMNERIIELAVVGIKLVGFLKW